jgi:hypothetical protein
LNGSVGNVIQTTADLVKQIIKDSLEQLGIDISLTLSEIACNKENEIIN